MFIYRFVLPMLYGLVTEAIFGFSDDDEDDLASLTARVLFLGNLNSYPFIGQVVEHAYVTVWNHVWGNIESLPGNKEKAFALDAGMTEELQEQTKFFKSGLKAFETGDPEDIGETFEDVLLPVGSVLGVPARNLYKRLSGWLEEETPLGEKISRTLGFSKPASEKLGEIEVGPLPDFSLFPTFDDEDDELEIEETGTIEVEEPSPELPTSIQEAVRKSEEAEETLSKVEVNIQERIKGE